MKAIVRTSMREMQRELGEDSSKNESSKRETYFNIGG
jgi:hypothetical protein